MICNTADRDFHQIGIAEAGGSNSTKHDIPLLSSGFTCYTYLNILSGRNG